jgi:hypothetical protein
MKKRLIPIIIIATLCFNNCKKEEMNSSFETKIISNWLVVNADNSAGVVEWGLYYVGSIKLYADKSFKVNLGTSIDDNTSKTGTWELDDTKNSIIFYSVINDLQTIYRDTTEFNISIDLTEKLILKNDWISIPHQKLNN